MISLFLYLLKSTVSLGIFYLLFRLLMRRETNFAFSRILLLTLVVASVIVPLVQLPRVLQPSVKVELIPDFSENRIQLQNSSEAGPLTQPEENLPAEEFTPESNLLDFSLPDFLMVIYCAGVLLSLLMLVKSIASVLLIFRKASFRQMPGYRLYITEKETPSFAFGRSVVISRADYEQHGEAILAHEQAHIRLNHFYDLVLLELVRAFHWFNPAAHALIGDMKEVHEFQADSETLKSGVNITHYQLLIIQKGAGLRRFALANSFNHCQIKKRLTMMNKLKTTKAKWWKAAAFLPLLAFLLMAFGEKGENKPVVIPTTPTVLDLANDSVKNWTASDFKVLTKKDREKIFFENQTLTIVQINANSEIKLDDDRVSLDELSARIRKWLDYKSADQKEWIHFQKIEVSGHPEMMPMAMITITKDLATKEDDFVKLLNVVGNTILKIRDDYSYEIFENSYTKISTKQRTQIDKFIPFNVGITEAKFKKVEFLPSPPKPVVEINVVNGEIFLKDKMCSIQELEKTVSGINMPFKFARINSNSEKDRTLVADIVEMLRNHRFGCQIKTENVSLKN